MTNNIKTSPIYLHRKHNKVTKPRKLILVITDNNINYGNNEVREETIHTENIGTQTTLVVQRYAFRIVQFDDTFVITCKYGDSTLETYYFEMTNIIESGTAGNLYEMIDFGDGIKYNYSNKSLTMFSNIEGMDRFISYLKTWTYFDEPLHIKMSFIC